MLKIANFRAEITDSEKEIMDKLEKRLKCKVSELKILHRSIDARKKNDVHYADYKLAVHFPNGRSLYTFCMCPGGYVVASQSEKETIVTNGMSYKNRDGKNSNSAILVNILPSDLPTSHPLSGMYLQREIEKNAYQKTGGYYTPCETVGSFFRCGKNELGAVKPTDKPGFITGIIQDLLLFIQSNIIRFRLM